VIEKSLSKSLNQSFTKSLIETQKENPKDEAIGVCDLQRESIGPVAVAVVSSSK